MDQSYEHKLFNVENDVQDRSSEAWKKLCEYVDKVAEEGGEEFSPYEYLGKDLYLQIHTLPASIAKLKTVKKIWLYGSRLKRIPPEIGEMESLEYFDPYTSYQLHWFPYEISRCKQLKDSRVSTRALYGNFKYRRPFPDLTDNPVRYDTEPLTCSVCRKEMTYAESNQLWLSLRIGTDVLPLLLNVCSKICEDKLPPAAKDHVPIAHKGGEDLVQPPTWDDIWLAERAKMKAEQKDTPPRRKLPKTKPITYIDEKTGKKGVKLDISGLRSIKLVRKIWEKKEDETNDS